MSYSASVVQSPFSIDLLPGVEAPPLDPWLGPWVVIYTRYSTTMQHDESCDAQETKVRQEFLRQGIDCSHLLVLTDKAMRGDLDEGRAAFDRLYNMIKNKQVSVLGVDQQSRLSRSSSVLSFIEDLTFEGGRFPAGIVAGS